jgi:hypothetical protein
MSELAGIPAVLSYTRRAAAPMARGALHDHHGEELGVTAAMA